MPVISKILVDRPEPPPDELEAPTPRSSSNVTVPKSRLIQQDRENLNREQATPHAPRYVYLIHMVGTTFYKIGMSLDPEIRRRTLQTGNPYQLEIKSSKTVDDIRGVESGLHRLFRDQQLPNVDATEWFDFDDEALLQGVQEAFTDPMPERFERPRRKSKRLERA